MTIQRLYATLALAAAALLVAGCGGGNGMGGATSPPATSAVTKSDTPGDTGGGGASEPTDPDMSVSLPDNHAIAEAGMHTVPADATLKVAGVRFSCEGAMDCVVTVTVDDEGAVTATYAGGEPTAAALDATGNQAFENLSAALLDADQSADLRANLYHDLVDDTATQDVDESKGNPGGGVTSSLTTHEEPGAIDDDSPLTGVSDIFVSVDPEVVRAMDDHATAEVQILDPVSSNEDTISSTVNDPVLVDEDGMVISDRTSSFVADADWDRNPAAEWTTDPALMGATQNMDEDEDDIWTNYFQVKQDLAGGRTWSSICVRTTTQTPRCWAQSWRLRGDRTPMLTTPRSESTGTTSPASASPWAVKSTSTKTTPPRQWWKGWTVRTWASEAGSPVRMEAKPTKMATASAGSTTTRMA